MQPLLPFVLPDMATSASDYIITDANRLAHKAVIEHHWELPLMLLCGAEASGKTMLAKQWATKHQAEWLSKALPDEAISQVTSRAYVLDDVHHCDERQLFHLLNMVSSNKAQLLMTAKDGFAALPFTLPDTISRLRLAAEATISPPDDEMMTMLLHHHFTQHQLQYDEKLLHYIASRLERSYAALRHFVMSIDELSLTEKRPLTIPLARELLKGS